jgi:hypothetical protein
MGRPNKYSPEVRERAVRMVHRRRSGHLDGNWFTGREYESKPGRGATQRHELAELEVVGAVNLAHATRDNPDCARMSTAVSSSVHADAVAGLECNRG